VVGPKARAGRIPSGVDALNAAPVLAAESVTVRFGPLVAVNQVSIDVEAGRTVSLIGPNGAGKTTLLNTISGFLPAATGTLRIDGQDVSSLRSHERSQRGIRRTFQHAKVSDALSVMENVLVGASLQGYPWTLFGEWLRLPRSGARMRRDREAAMSLLELLGIADTADVPVGALSFGRKKMVDLARALMTPPRLLLMDEPTAGMSEPEVETLAHLMSRIQPDTAILVVAHHMGFVAKVAHKVVCLVAGQIIASGTPREVQADPRVLAAYMGT